MAVLDNRNAASTGVGNWKTFLPNGTVGSQGTYSVPGSSRDRVYREGTGRRSKPAVLDTTPYNRREERYRNFTGICENTLTSGSSAGIRQVYDGPYLWVSAWQSKRLAVDSANALSGFANIAKVRAMKQLDNRDMDLGTAWVERGKTIELVRQVAETGLQALKAIKRRDGRGLLNALGLDSYRAAGEGFVNTYLAYHYGMRPLLQDISGAVQALARSPSGAWTVRTKATYGQPQAYNNVLVAANMPLRMQGKYEASARVVVTARQKALIREQDLLWSLGLDNALGTAWELVPYSFVADWMFGVGDYLQAVNSIKYYDSWLFVTTQRQKEEGKLSGASASGSGFKGKSTGSGEYYSRYLYRTISNNPIVGLPIKDPRSLDHMAKALSLLAAASYRDDIPKIIRY